MKTTSHKKYNGCGSKLKHQSMESASAAAMGITAARNQFYVPYGPCRECGYYHVGHARRRKSGRSR